MNVSLGGRSDHNLENQQQVFDFNKTKQQNEQKISEATTVEK